LFVESDLVVLRNFQQIIQSNNLPLGNAAKLVVDRCSQIRKKDHRDSKRYEEVTQQLLDHIDKQKKFNQELKRLEQQQKYIKERLIEQNKMLIASQKEEQETRKLLVASQEEQKKNFWKRLFGK
jgi:hypothetical protein